MVRYHLKTGRLLGAHPERTTRNRDHRACQRHTRVFLVRDHRPGVPNAASVFRIATGGCPKGKGNRRSGRDGAVRHQR